MVDSTSGWPITTSIRSLQKAVSLFEEEVILDQLSLNLFGHSLQRIIGATKLSIWIFKCRLEGIETPTRLKLLKNPLNFVLHFRIILFSQARIERISLKTKS